MPRLLMHCLLLSSVCVWISSCHSTYGLMHKVDAHADCLDAFRPRFSKALYNTQVNVTGKHMSGLLLLKIMPDSSTRIVFSNEMGFKYFDFAFAADGTFKVYYVLPAMDKKPVL